MNNVTEIVGPESAPTPAAEPVKHTQAKPAEKVAIRRITKKADTMRQAAVALGRDVAILKAMKRAGCPAFLAGSRVDISLLRSIWGEWEVKLAESGMGAGGLDEQIKAEKLRKLKLENAELDRQVIDRASVAERMSGLAARANAILQNRLIIELPPLVAGMDAAGVRAECESIHARICADFKAFAEEWK